MDIRKHVRLLLVMLGMVAITQIAFLPYVAGASSDYPWRNFLVCDPDLQKYRGVEYCASEDGKVLVAVVDLHASGVRLEYVIAHGVDRNGNAGECKDVNIPRWGPVNGGCADPRNHARYPSLSLKQAVMRMPDAAVIVNSDYFSPEYQHGPEGFTVVRGRRLDGRLNGDTDDNASRRPWLAVSGKAPLRAEIRQFPIGKDNGGKPEWVYTGVGGGPWLVRHGQIARKDILTCKNVGRGACRKEAEQTAVGLSTDHRWLYLVVYLRKDGVRSLAQFMHDDLDVWDAMKFDGGSSTQMAYAGRVLVGRNGRRLTQYLAVIAQPGHGIEAHSGVKPSVTKRLNQKKEDLEKRLEQAMKRQVEKWERSIERELGKMLREAERRAEREVEREIQKRFDETCGGSMVIGLSPLFLAIVLGRRKRRGR